MSRPAKVIDVEYEVVDGPQFAPSIEPALGVTASEWSAWHLLAKLVYVVVYVAGMGLVYLVAKTLLDLIFPT